MSEAFFRLSFGIEVRQVLSGYADLALSFKSADLIPDAGQALMIAHLKFISAVSLQLTDVLIRIIEYGLFGSLLLLQPFVHPLQFLFDALVLQFEYRNLLQQFTLFAFVVLNQ